MRPVSYLLCLTLLSLAPSVLPGVAQAETTAETRQMLEARMSDPALASSLRMDAVCALYEVADHTSVPPLMDLLEQDLIDRHGFWACAIPTLGHLGDRRAVPLLRKISDLKQDHLAGMDHMAIEALAAMATVDDTAWLANRAHIFPVRDAVFQALARVGDAATADMLVSGLGDGETTVVITAATAGLIRIGNPALPALEDGQNHPDEVLRTRATDIAAAIRQTGN